MASPQVTQIIPSRPPTQLSYADRAKKAQNLRSSQPLAQSQSLATSSYSSSSNTNQSASNASLSASSVEVTPTSSAVPTRPQTRPVSPSSSSGPHTTEDVPKAPAMVPVISGALQSASNPAANFWSLRKEQMAQTQSQSRPPLPLPAAQSTRNRNTSVDSSTANAPSSRHLLTANISNQHKSHTSSAANLSPNGNVPVVPSLVTPNSPKDPFTIRPPPHDRRPLNAREASQAGFPLSPSASILPQPPAVDDKESWPEVGKSGVVNGSASANGSIGDKESEGKEQTNGTVRKAEKTKWVAIPPSELLAAADASAPRSSKNSSRSRNGDQRNSAQSQASSSRLQSGRNSKSHSAAPSVAPHSRTGSGQSSPNISSGKGRPLPGEMAKTETTDGSPLAPVDTGEAIAANSPYQQPVIPRTNSFYPSPVIQPYHHPSHPHSQAHSHSNSYTGSQAQSPMIGSYGPPLAATNGYHMHPLDPSYQGSYGPPQQFAGAYDYSQPSQHYRMYWGEPGHMTPPTHGQPRYSLPPPMQYPQMAPPRHLERPLVQVQQRRHSQSFAHSGQASPSMSLPPPTLLVHPQSPRRSEAVAGYREVLVGADGAGAPVERGRRVREVVFGSIGVPGGEQSPVVSPPPAVAADIAAQPVDAQEADAEDADKPRSSFSIGVDPGEPGSRVRSRTRSTKGKGRVFMSDLTNTVERPESTDEADAKEVGGKWEFGTTSRAVGTPGTEDVAPQTGHPVSSGPRPFVVSAVSENAPPGIMSPPNGLHQPLLAAPIPTHRIEASLLSPLDVNGQGPRPGSAGDEFEVKDYGWGFGAVSGTGYAPDLTRAERVARQEEQERERGKHMVEWEREHGFGPGLRAGRPRRGSFAGGPGGAYVSYDNRGGFEHRGGFESHGGFESRGGFAFEPRGGYEPRDGFEARRGFGGRRGRGFRGNNRGYNRGSHQDNGQNHQRQLSQQSSQFAITPPPTFQPLVPGSEMAHLYYAPPHIPPLVTNYLPNAYEPFQPPPPQSAISSGISPIVPPVPAPLTPINFPLDPKRYYLLGQLEYYMSAQNLAQDFYLRKQMDSRGWIPISLIASFNRIKALTEDTRLVKDVLILSSIVEVIGDSVRMGSNQWAPFVLPDAHPSIVEGHTESEGKSIPDPLAADETADVDVDSESVGVEGDDDDEDDVVFVMERATSEDTWAAARRQG